MENKKLNILLAEYINRNLGDTVIAECTKYFVEKALQNEGIQNYIIHDYNMYQEDMEYVKNADVVIFAGGGLIKYRREKFYQYVPDIIRIASENNIPVFINCTGVEGYDERDERCRRLKIAVNDACVKGITVRDDYQTFIKHYLETEKEWIGQVPDPAAFCSEVYGISGNPNTDKIGLGIARDGLFFDYGHQNITREFLLDFWKQVIFRLEELGYQWEIFNNGLHSDYEFGLDVLEYAGVENKKYFIRKRPAEGAELVRIISDYKGIIATRLHTNIIAYSMGCPSIGLVWNDKLAQWGAGIGHPERFVEADRMEALDVVSRLKRAMSEKHKKRGGGAMKS
ncbi:MAG: polysaccharide pyruvyl transferase family protein [Enterocloster clostridioformis]|nr:polysaccharide pyruvyl transferase family protein [Enterocloster clostridioformis]